MHTSIPTGVHQLIHNMGLACYRVFVLCNKNFHTNCSYTVLLSLEYQYT